MNLSNIAVDRKLESYLLQLRWSLGVLPAEDRDEIVAEIRSHFLERFEHDDPEAAFASLEKEFGPPEEYAQQFLENYRITSALASGSAVAMVRQGARLLSHGLKGFLGGFGLFTLYLLSVGLVLVGALKPVFPENVGLWAHQNGLFTLGYMQRIPESGSELLGYWIVPASIFVGLLLYVGTNGLMRRYLRSFRRR